VRFAAITICVAFQRVFIVVVVVVAAAAAAAVAVAVVYSVIGSVRKLLVTPSYFPFQQNLPYSSGIFID
jgi:hypothetical protein